MTQKIEAGMIVTVDGVSARAKVWEISGVVVRLEYLDNGEMGDVHIDKVQPAAAILALPDSQFVDSGAHVAIDSEIREGMATLPADFDSVAHLRQDLHPDTDYGRALQQVRFFAADLMEKHGEIHNLESELAAAKAEIKRLRGLLGEAKQTFLGVQLTLWSVNGRTGELLATKGLDAIDTGVVEGMARHSKRSTQDVGDMLAKLESDTQS